MDNKGPQAMIMRIARRASTRTNLAIVEVIRSRETVQTKTKMEYLPVETMLSWRWMLRIMRMNHII